MTTCIEMPVQHTAGLTFQAAVEAAEHPVPAWTITLHLRGPSQIDLTAAPGGYFTATAAETATWAPGAYWWTIRATDGAEVVELERGTMGVLPDPVAATGAFDGRSDNEKALVSIDAVLARRATIDQSRYVINNRELWRTPIAELIKLRAFYAAAVGRERRKASGRRSWGRPVHMRFS